MKCHIFIDTSGRLMLFIGDLAYPDSLRYSLHYRSGFARISLKGGGKFYKVSSLGEYKLFEDHSFKLDYNSGALMLTLSSLRLVDTTWTWFQSKPVQFLNKLEIQLIKYHQDRIRRSSRNVQNV
jgi:hypothetical protein